jgi:hypothetical protein
MSSPAEKKKTKITKVIKLPKAHKNWNPMMKMRTNTIKAIIKLPNGK